MVGGLIRAEPADGCSPLVGANYSGNLVIVDRGTCSFYLKAYHAQQSNASGIIVKQSEVFPPFAMGFDMVDQMMYGPIHIPVVMISQFAGNKIQALRDECALSHNSSSIWH